MALWILTIIIEFSSTIKINRSKLIHINLCPSTKVKTIFPSVEDDSDSMQAVKHINVMLHILYDLGKVICEILVALPSY